MKKVLNTVGAVSALIASDDYVNRIREFYSDMKQEFSLMDCLQVVGSWAVEFQLRNRSIISGFALIEDLYPLSKRFEKVSSWEDAVLDFAEYKFSAHKQCVTSPTPEPVFSFNYLSPDNITISLDNFLTVEAAAEYLVAWVNRFEKQGYYSSNSEKIPLDSLADRCEFVIFNNGVLERTGLSYLKLDPEEIERIADVPKRLVSSQTLSFLDAYAEFKGKESLVDIVSAAEYWDQLDPLVSAEVHLLASACFDLEVSYIRLC